MLCPYSGNSDSNSSIRLKAAPFQFSINRRTFFTYTVESKTITYETGLLLSAHKLVCTSGDLRSIVSDSEDAITMRYEAPEIGECCKTCLQLVSTVSLSISIRQLTQIVYDERYVLDLLLQTSIHEKLLLVVLILRFQFTT